MKLFLIHARTATLIPFLTTILCLSFLCVSPALAADFEMWETDNGMRVLFAPASSLPMLDIRLIFDAGSARDGQKGGLARMTNLALAFGTQELNTDAVADRFESVGAQFSTSAGRDMAMLRLRTLTEKDWLEIALDTFIALLSAPAFPEEDLSRARRQTLQALQRERQEPGALASRRFFQLAYKGHPYANHPLGDEQSVPGLDRQAVSDFFPRHYTAQNAVLAMTGDVHINEARSISQRISKVLPQGERLPELPPVTPPKDAVEDAPKDAPKNVVVEHIPFASEQAHIFVGGPVLQRGDPDRFPLTVANHVFGGGGFTSRLFREIRNERGLAYSVFSHIQPMAAPGPFLINMQTGVDQAREAVKVLHDELAIFIQDGVNADELAASQANLIGQFPLGLASNSDIVAILGAIGFYGLPADYLATYTDHLARVTLGDVQDALTRRLQPDAMVTVVVGGPEGLF